MSALNNIIDDCTLSIVHYDISVYTPKYMMHQCMSKNESKYKFEQKTFLFTKCGYLHFTECSCMHLIIIDCLQLQPQANRKPPRQFGLIGHYYRSLSKIKRSDV